MTCILIAGAFATAGAEELFVAVGEAGRRASSRDGVVWENEQRWKGDLAARHGALLDVAYGDGRFVAVGGGKDFGQILTTRDGSEWVEVLRSSSCVETIAFGRLATSEPCFVAMRGSELLHSADGVRFVAGEKLALRGEIHARRSAFGDTEAGRRFVIVGDVAGEGAPASWRAVTPDGRTFSSTEVHTASARDVAHGAGRFVVVGSRGLIESSHDGETWTRHRVPSADDFGRVIWTGARFLVSSGKAGWTSPDGIAWTREAGTAPGNVIWGAESASPGSLRLFSIAPNGALHRSARGEEWEPVALGSAPSWKSVASAE